MATGSHRIVHWGTASLSLLATAGCSSLPDSLPWSFDAPPTVAQVNAGPRSTLARTVIVVGEFGSPRSSSTNWRDIGPGMSSALNKTLLNDGRYDVWIRPDLSRQVQDLLGRSRGQSRDLHRVGQAHPDVNFVIIGKVTDFAHTSELPEEVARWGVFGKRQEAFVAIDFSIVEMSSGRVIAADHIYATASADDKPVRDIYRDINFGSYLFWSTPLGQASKAAIARTIDRIEKIVPLYSGELRVLKLVDIRRVEVSGGRKTGLEGGQQFYLCAKRSDGSLELINDADIDRPLMVKIDTVREDSATAWLLGRKPPLLELRGAVLSREVPVSREASAHTTLTSQ